MSFRFNGTSDYIEFAFSPLASYTFGPCTIAVFLKQNAHGNDTALTAITDSGLTIKFLNRLTGDELQLLNPAAGGAVSALGLTSTTLWYLMVTTWAGSAAIPRFHVHNGTSWTHQTAGSSSIANYTSTGTDRLRFGAWTANFLQADAVCVGIKKTDSTDLAVTALSRTSFATWAGFGFDWLIGFDSSFVSAGKLQDLASPGTGDETSRSGVTTGVTDPPGWSYTLSTTWNGSSTVSLTDTVTTAGNRLGVTSHGASTTTETVAVTTASRAVTLHASTAVAETVTVTTSAALERMILVPRTPGGLVLVPRPPDSLVLTPR